MKKHLKNHQAGFTLIEFIVSLVIAAILAAMISTYFGNALTQSTVPIARLQQVSKLRQVMENIVADYNRLNALNLRYRWQPSTPYGLNAVVTPKTIPSTPNGGHYYISTTAGTSSTTTEPTWLTSGTLPADGGVIWKESGNIVWQKAPHSYSIGAVVVPIKNNGHYYICTTGGSNTTVPDWKTTPSDVTTVTGARWTEAGTILESAVVTDNLKYYLTSTPGRYDNNSSPQSYTVVETKFVQFDSTYFLRDAGTGTPATSSEKNILQVTIKSNDSAETLTQLFTIR